MGTALLTTALIGPISVDELRPLAGWQFIQDSVVRYTHQTLPRTWIFPGGEAPPMCLLLLDQGVGKFVGGFLFDNPLRWSYAPEKGQLTLTLHDLDSATAEVFAYHARRGHYSLDIAHRSIHYELDTTTAGVLYANWLFYKPSNIEQWMLKDGTIPCRVPGHP